MTDPFEELERQLRGAVRASATSPAPGSASSAAPPRRRRWRIGRTPLIVIAALGLTVSGAAVAATSLHFSKSDRQQGDSIANEAISDSFHTAACVPLAGKHRDITMPQLDATPSPAILAALPWLGVPPTPGERAHTARLLHGGAGGILALGGGSVLRGTARVITMRPGQDLLVYVQAGNGMWEMRDPVRCAQIRRHRAAQLGAGHSAAAQQWARKVIDTDPSINRQTQTVGMATDFACGKRRTLCGWGGGGANLVADATSPHARLRLGLQGSGSSNGAPTSRYYGIAGPSARRILVRATHHSTFGPVPRYAVVRKNLWVLDLPLNTGPVRLTEVDAAGAVLRKMSVRGTPKFGAVPATAVHLH